MEYKPVQLVITLTKDGLYKITTFDKEKVINEATLNLTDSVLAIIAEELPSLVSG